jgi:hypothetical protein
MRFKIITTTILFGSVAFANSATGYINSIRINSGAFALSWSNQLAMAAKAHAKYLATNKEFGHQESFGNKNFYASMPWQRIVKAGYATKAVVENITFYEPNYKASIDKLMATIYHRLALLDIKVDTIGFARYKGVYVYDMSNSKIATMCKSKSISGDITNICKNPSKSLPNSRFNSAIKQTKRAAKEFIYYPYNNQTQVGTKLAKERPAFLPNSSRYGYAITVQHNSVFGGTLKLVTFKVFNNKREIKGKIVTFRNDRAKKLDKNSFVFVPLKALKHNSKYSVVFKAKVNGKPKRLSWSFYTN